MASFVLVHGAWHGGWCFDPVRALLEEAGHRVFTPDLPGMGGSDAELAGTSLQGWGDYVADICRRVPGPVILCGHSRGGIVISTAAEAAPEAMTALVYICAMLLPDGMSRGAWKVQQERNPAFDAIILRHPTGPATQLDLAGVSDVMAQLSPPDLVVTALARLVAEPDGPRLTALSLSDARYGIVPRHYIECLQDRTIPVADQRRMQALQPCLTTTSIDCDHSPFLSAPRALADALLSIARGYDT